MAGFLDGMAQVLLPKGRGKVGGVGFTPGYRASQPLMTVPTYRQHLTDLFNTRVATDSRTLLNDLFNHDPDVSAAVNAYLSIAESSTLVLYAYNENDEVDPEGIKMARRLLTAMTTTSDYTLGYSSKNSVDAMINNHRYMMLLRGSTAMELVLDKQYVPTELRLVDMKDIQWRQPKPGVLEPFQKPSGSNTEINLNVPTFFSENYHQNPVDVYTYSTFVSSINTIAARTEVINELYRIMKIVGYPRLDVEVLEEVLVANAPVAFRSDPVKIREHVDQEIAKVRAGLASLAADQTLVHSSAVKASILNDKNPGAGMQIQGVIDVLDNQNQAALKVMPAVVGRSSNATTASTEARLFAMTADSLNRSIASILSKSLTFGVRLAGYPGRVEARFTPIEMRPVLELEPHLTMRGARLRQELSLGTITDIEYHMELFGRPPPDGAPELSGTNFLSPSDAAGDVNPEDVSVNGDSLGRDLASPGGKSAGSNATKTGSVKK